MKEYPSSNLALTGDDKVPGIASDSSCFAEIGSRVFEKSSHRDGCEVER
jgi:hypothetical protein